MPGTQSRAGGTLPARFSRRGGRRPGRRLRRPRPRNQFVDDQLPAGGASLPQPEYVDPVTVQVGVDIDRPTLDARIEQRVDAMFAAGLVEEVARLLEEGLAEGRTAGRAIGYVEVMAHLAGELSLEEARERTVVATRRFARRQDAWFRKDPRVVWVGHDDPDRVERASEAVGRMVP